MAIAMPATAANGAPERVGEDPDARHVDAGREGGRVVAADGEQHAVVRQALEQDPHDHRDGDQHETARDRPEPFGEVLRPALRRCGRRPRDLLVDPLEHEQHAERRDDRLVAEHGDGEPVHEPDRGAERENDRHGDPCAPPRPVREEVEDQDVRDEPCVEADRDVEPAASAQDGGSRGHRHEGEGREEHEVRVEVARAAEARKHRDVRDEQHDGEQQREREAARPQESPDLRHRPAAPVRSSSRRAPTASGSRDRAPPRARPP